MTRSKLAIIGVLTAAALAASAVYAGKNSSDDEIDAATLAKANVALDQAITAAEQHTQGKAVQAELEDENGKLVDEVEVMKGATAMDVTIDATTVASVVSSRWGKARDCKPNVQVRFRVGEYSASHDGAMVPRRILNLMET